MSKRKNKGSKTSSFGSPGRASHDSSSFYDSRLYQGLAPGESVKHIEHALPKSAQNTIFQNSSESMSELPDNCVHLMITSPPYNVKKDYDEDLTLDEYRQFLRVVLEETHRVLVAGGRACVNVANLGRKPYIPLHTFIIKDMLDLGYLMRGEIIWNKAASASPSTAWGSWLSASNPVLRDVHEYILVFSKDSFSRQREGQTSTITKDDFLELTKSVWTFPAISAKRIGHPAPFPDELPRRLIELYTFEGDVVLDPFCGSGSTFIAAVNTGRTYVGYEINSDYVEIAQKRIKEALQQKRDSE
ncbi:MAG: site-specific DNA-methyltransferase [Anaerolineales bacterium]|nr:site-specific DNA-methyltransferase [Anaerolineales bacterium]